MVAAEEGHLPVVRWLLHQGVNLGCRISDGATALHLAAANGAPQATAPIGAGATANTCRQAMYLLVELGLLTDQLNAAGQSQANWQLPVGTVRRFRNCFVSARLV